MRRLTRACLASLFFAATSSALSAQQSIYMMVDPIKGDQVAPHAGEFKLGSFSSASTNAISIASASGGAATGRASFSPVKVSMRFNAAASPLFARSLASGTALPSIEVRFYNPTRMFYKTVFENVYVTNVSTDAGDDAVQQIEFVYSRIKWFAPSDAAGVNPPAQVGCWDIAANRGC